MWLNKARVKRRVERTQKVDRRPWIPQLWKGFLSPTEWTRILFCSPESHPLPDLHFFSSSHFLVFPFHSLSRPPSLFSTLHFLFPSLPSPPFSSPTSLSSTFHHFLISFSSWLFPFLHSSPPVSLLLLPSVSLNDLSLGESLPPKFIIFHGSLL